MQTLSQANLTDDQQQSIGIYAEKMHMKDAIARKGLRDAGVDFDAMLTPRDQEFIMFWADVVGDAKVTTVMFGSEEPTEEISAAKFTRILHKTMREHGKMKIRQDVLAATKGAKAACFRRAAGGRLVIHPAVRQDRTSDWQLTTIGDDGLPWGHNNPPTFEEAVLRAAGVSDDYYWNETGYSYEWSDNTGTKPPF